ncbi:unnamed protein product [Mytilus coruscus]|uniref:Uncharacterized protein n=1 Tax=Mytilus coruscus TaxID=42192 RepID=A0A6J8EYV3_MYTCO|nr:unnamed protein product [Mytilus coruscus]
MNLIDYCTCFPTETKPSTEAGAVEGTSATDKPIKQVANELLVNGKINYSLSTKFYSYYNMYRKMNRISETNIKMKKGRNNEFLEGKFSLPNSCPIDSSENQTEKEIFHINPDSTTSAWFFFSKTTNELQAEKGTTISLEQEIDRIADQVAKVDKGKKSCLSRSVENQLNLKEHE